MSTCMRKYDSSELCVIGRPVWIYLSYLVLYVTVRLLSSHLLPNVLSLLFSQDHIPVPYQPDSSSNPSSTTSSTPSSPAPPLPPSATPPSPLHPSPQCTRQQKPFNLPGTETHLDSAHSFLTWFCPKPLAQERLTVVAVGAYEMSSYILKKIG